ncbi:MAG: outer membrane beta-barrel protein [Pseudomonadales bacterium]|jgi:opacity protein-like surface antigen|nr:outer membrane beta-barrel protein [Pseudomonadales bacterium]
MQLKSQGLLALVASAALLGATSQATAAEGPDWTFVDFGYQYVDFDDFDEEADVLRLGGSYAASDLVHVFAGYRDGSIDTNFGDIDISEFDLGIGVNPQLSDTVDLFGRIGWATADVDFDGFGDADDDGFTVQAGVRAMVTPQWEINGGIRYVDLGDDETELGIGTVYTVSDIVAITGDLGFSNDRTTFGIGVRIYPRRR